MMDIHAPEASQPIHGVQAVTLGQKVVKGSRFGGRCWTCRAVRPHELCPRRFADEAATSITYRRSLSAHLHGRPQIRQAEYRARDGDRDRLACVETEKH